MKVMNRNFIMVLIGQIISLFGNAIVRFALPLYLLNETGSASLFGIVSAVAFIPMIIMMPIGGIIADRVNKRNIMVILDFSTAIIISAFTLIMGKVDLVTIIMIVMVLLYAISGTYAPAVQASIPLLVESDGIVKANSLINVVNSLSSLLGPVLGGILFSFAGIKPLLVIGIICFFFSAVMEIFIRIPHTKQANEEGIFKTGAKDFAESMRYVCRDQRAILKVTIIAALTNLVASSCITIGLPVIITARLGFEASKANMLYGYLDGIYGAGALIGGILASIIGSKIKLGKVHRYLFAAALTFFPIAVILFMNTDSMVKYFVIMASAAIMMVFSTIFNIRIMSELQLITPTNMLGKVIGCVYCLCMCATPLGNAIFGGLFEHFADSTHMIILVSGIIMAVLSLFAGKAFREMENDSALVTIRNASRINSADVATVKSCEA